MINDTGATVTLAPATSGDFREFIIKGTPTEVNAATSQIKTVIRSQGKFSNQLLLFIQEKVLRLNLSYGIIPFGVA